jgi:hypothetical protein
MNGRDPADLLRAALNRTGTTLTISPGRSVSSGLHEVREFGPALRASLSREGAPGEAVLLNQTVEMANWNRQASQVDLVVVGSGAAPALVAELKVWDIGDQLFDLAKVCCLLAARCAGGIPDFGRQAGERLRSAPWRRAVSRPRSRGAPARLRDAHRHAERRVATPRRHRRT